MPTAISDAGESKTGGRKPLQRQTSSPLREYLGINKPRQGGHHPDFSGRKSLRADGGVGDDSQMLQKINSYNLRLQEIEDEETTKSNFAFTECCENTPPGILCASCVAATENTATSFCKSLYSEDLGKHG